MTATRTHKRTPRRVHLHAYERLSRICAEIQRGRYPTKTDLARLVERHPRTVQRDLEALVNDFDAPLEFDRANNGFHFTDPQWQLPPVALSEGELISFFAAERVLRRLGAASEVQLARAALRRLAALLPAEVVVDVAALEEAITFAPEPVLDASPAILRRLASAAMRRRTLHINYYSQRRAAHTERDVDVLLLHNHLGEWYGQRLGRRPDRQRPRPPGETAGPVKERGRGKKPARPRRRQEAISRLIKKAPDIPRLHFVLELSAGGSIIVAFRLRGTTLCPQVCDC